MSIYLNLAQEKILETKRLRLRPMELMDAENMFEYASNIKNSCFVFEKHETLESTKKFIANQFLKNTLLN